ncbi:hypothetical protein BH11PLA1_BH11PLA1_04840 [soil metagenome]
MEGFTTSSFTSELDVVDTRAHEVVARVPPASPFSRNRAVSHDGKEVWFTFKDSTSSPTAPFGDKKALVTFQTNVSGAQDPPAVGFLRVLSPPGKQAARQPRARFLVATRADGHLLELVQKISLASEP